MSATAAHEQTVTPVNGYIVKPFTGVTLARVSGARCSERDCRRLLMDGEPIYWHPAFGSCWTGHGRCLDCIGGGRPRAWCGPRPCPVCERPVYDALGDRYGGRRDPRLRPLCSTRCSSVYYSRRRQGWSAEALTRDCATCGERFEATRRDAVTCSPACRQKAYRRRAAEGRAA
jgi:hypothetical protein